MSKKDKINFLFFENKLTIIEIASKLKITKQYISKVVRQDSRYEKERENRKLENKEKQKQRVKEYIYTKRKKEKRDRLNAIVEMQHIQASHELSGRRTINNRAYRNWNNSIYEYNELRGEYQIKKEYKNRISYSVPKRVKWT